MTPRFTVDFNGANGAHSYRLNGEERPSVTTILKACGLTDYEWCEEEHRIRGQKVHRIAQLLSRNWRGNTIEEIVQNSRWDVARTSPALIGYGYAAAAFLLEQQFRPELVEEPVGSVSFQFCGTIDAHGVLPNGQSLLPDYKSGQPQSGAWIQTGLYAYALEETYGITTDLRAPVWLKKDGSYKMLPPRPAGGPDLAIGQQAVNLYHWRRVNGML